MKLASKVVLLFNDSDGLGLAVANSLRLNPSIQNRRREEPFELSLKADEINNRKVAGVLINFIDEVGTEQVSLMLLERYDPPLLACALNEVVTQIQAGWQFGASALILPVLNFSSRTMSRENDITSTKFTLFGHHIGPVTDTSRSIDADTQKPSSRLQIQYEPAACMLQLARLRRIPTSVLIWEALQADLDIEIIGNVGAFLAKITGLYFSKDHLRWNPREKTGSNNAEPWQALYG